MRHPGLVPGPTAPQRNRSRPPRHRRLLPVTPGSTRGPAALLPEEAGPRLKAGVTALDDGHEALYKTRMNLAAPLHQQFRTDWSNRFGSLPPIGWVLRESGRPWIRFHALPASKRYPEDAAERATILARAYALGGEILGEGKECWCVVSRFSDGQHARDDAAILYFEDPDPSSSTVRLACG
jgi:hypothetical protein